MPTLPVQGFILVGSLLYVAGKTALTRSGKAAGEAAVGLGTMVLTVGAGVAAIDILAVAGDNFASWIISRSVIGDMALRLGAVSGGSADMAVLGLGLHFVVALLGIVSCIISRGPARHRLLHHQIFFLLARVGVLTVLAGTLPLSTAAMATPAGKAWFKRIVGWIIAFLLYKPAAALIYASAFTLTAGGEDLLSTWYSGHLDHQLPILTAAAGPFADCEPAQHFPPQHDRLHHASAPADWWPPTS